MVDGAIGPAHAGAQLASPGCYFRYFRKVFTQKYSISRVILRP